MITVRQHVLSVCITFIAVLINACRSNNVGIVLTPTPDIGNVSIGNSQDQISVATTINNSETGDPVLIVARPIDIEIQHAINNRGNHVLHLDNGAKVTYDPLVLFGENSNELKPSSKENLSALADVLNEHSKANIVIEGHTDNEGPVQKNQALSDQRAEAVAKFLINKNISADRIKWKGYGDTQPLFSNKTSQGRKRNRRVEIIIIENNG